MARPLLPPRGVHVPARMIYCPQLSPAVILTWIQLRGLAWGGMVTPPLRMQELTALTGKSQASIYGHMTLLRSISALSWRSAEQGTIIVSFAEKPFENPASHEILPPNSRIPKSQNQDSRILEYQNPPSLNPHSSSSMTPSLDLSIKESDQIIRNEGERSGEGEFEGGRPIPDSQKLPSDPVQAYRSLAHLTPNASQRRILDRRKSPTCRLWQETLEHWLMHGWNPHNLTGMLELYGRGGVTGCRYCHPESPPHSKVRTPLQGTLASIEAVRKKLRLPASSG